MDSVMDGPNVILVASWLQGVSYLHLSMLALFLHDWLILFDREVEYIWKSDWSVVKILFIITRYGPLLDMPITVTTHVAPSDAIGASTCETLYKISTWNTFFGISISETILLLRTSAIYSKSKRVMIPLSVAYLIAVVAGTVIAWHHIHTSYFGPPPGALLEACYIIPKDGMIFYNFLMLLILELAFVILTARSGLHSFYSGTPLLWVMYRDSVAFFLVLFALTLSTILVLALGPVQFSGAMAASTRIVHSIVCCRILLNLRQAATRREVTVGPSAGMVFAAAPGQQTNPAETIRLETRDTRDDEEAVRWSADSDEGVRSV